jgi:hypothetical protein
MNFSLSGPGQSNKGSSTPLGMTTGADRNAGSTFLRMILLSPNGKLTAFGSLRRGRQLPLQKNQS